MQILQQAAEAFKSQGDVLNQALALNYLALAYQQQGDLSQASKAIALSLQLLSKNERNSPEYFSVDEAKNLQDLRAEAYALGTLGGIYEQTKQLAIAQTQTQQALTIAESIQAPDIGYRWQWQLGRILNARGEKEGAIAAYTKAVDNLKSIRREKAKLRLNASLTSFGVKVGCTEYIRHLL